MRIENGKLRNHFSCPSGFTLIELIVVFAVLAVATTTGLASYASYTNTQTFKNTVADVASLVKTAKSRTLSQVKPDQCANQTLNGYQVSVTPAGRNYALDAVCNGNSYALDTRTLPAQISFKSDSVNTVFFTVAQLVVPKPGSISIQGFGKSSTISVDAAGNVAVN